MGRTKNPDDILGRRYGKVTIEKYLGILPYKSGNSESSYLCKCDCGNYAVARRSQILMGKRKSCGHCFRVEQEEDYCRYTDHNGNSFIYDVADNDTVLKHSGRLRMGDMSGRVIMERKSRWPGIC